MSDTDRAPQSAPPETSVPPDQPEPADASETTPELATLQQWFQAVIMHPDGVTAGISSPAAREQIHVGPADVGLGDGDRDRPIERRRTRVVERLQCIAGRCPRPLEVDQHVGGLVLYGLKRTDRTTELEARGRVVDRRFENALHSAHHLGA